MASGARVDGRRKLDASGINCLALMEDMLEKIKIINYPLDNKPLNRIYFATELQAAEQFPVFSSLVNWLFNFIKHSFVEWNEYDDPNTICNSISVEMKKLGFQADFPPSKLRTGWGDAVCVLLTFLLDRAMEQVQYTSLEPIYPVDSDDGVVDENVEINEDMIEELVEEHGDEASPAYSTAYTTDTGKEDHTEIDRLAIMETQIDPAEWKLELERVAPRLKVQAQAQADTKEWRTHLQQATKHEGLMRSISPDVETSLHKIGDELLKSIDRIRAKEKSINRDFDHLGGDFSGKQNELTEITERYNNLARLVQELESELNKKKDDLSFYKNQMDDKKSSMLDNSPIKRIKQAIAALQYEISQIHLRVGVAQQTLLQAKLKSVSGKPNRVEF